MTVDSCAHVLTDDRHLEINESALISIDSRNENVHTRLRVEANECYDFVATGEWSDAGIRSGPDGYDVSSVDSLPSRVFLTAGEPFRRARHERYFALIGDIDGSEDTRFLIGSSRRCWTASQTGELVAFANDVHHFYGNNSGCVVLNVIRISPPHCA